MADTVKNTVRQRNLLSLSEGTRQVLSEIDEPITLRFYYSSRIAEDLPDIGVYAQRVRDMLEEYASIADGKIRLEVFDPQPFTDEEDNAVAVGLQGVPIDQGGDLVYFGLSGTNSTDYQQVIPFFDQQRERFLEYDLTRLVYNLAHPKKPVVAVMSGLPISGSPYSKQVPGAPDDSWAIWGQLKDLFGVEEIPMVDAKIPDDADLLLLIHPDKIDDRSRRLQPARSAEILGCGDAVGGCNRRRQTRPPRTGPDAGPGRHPRRRGRLPALARHRPGPVE